MSTLKKKGFQRELDGKGHFQQSNEMEIAYFFIDMIKESVTFSNHAGDRLLEGNKKDFSALIGNLAWNNLLNQLRRNETYTQTIDKKIAKRDQEVRIFAARISEEQGFITVDHRLEVKLQETPAALVAQQIRADLAEEINEVLKLEIAEHKRTQAKLEKSERYTTSIIDSSLNMVISLDASLEIRELNRTALRILGFSRKELIGRTFESLLASKSSLIEMMQGISENGIFDGEIGCFKKSGDICDVSIGLSALKSDSGEFLGYVCSMRDISELTESRQKLATTVEKYTDLFENASDLIQGLNELGGVSYVNKAWKATLGYSEKEIKKLCFFDLLLPEDREKFKTYFSGITKGRPAKTQVWRLRKKNGNVLFVESKEHVNFKEGRPQTVQSIMRNVTNAIEADEQAQKQQAKIEAIFESGDIMLWTVNEKTALTSFNKKYQETIEKLYGHKAQINRDLNTPKKRFASDHYHDFWEKKYRKVFDTGKGISFETKTEDLKGKVYYREVFLNPIRDLGNDHKVIEVSGMAIDVSEKKASEKKMHEQSSKISTVFNAANYMVWFLDTQFKYTSYNQIYEKKMFDRFDVKIDVGKKAVELDRKYLKHDSTLVKGCYARVLKGETAQIELRMIDRHNKEHFEEIFLNPIYDEDGKVIEIAGISQTVTFKRAAERKLKDQAAKINAIFDSTAMLIWTIDSNLRIVSYNKVFAQQHLKLLGKEVSIGTDFIDGFGASINGDSVSELKKYYTESFRGEKQQFEGVIFGKDGKKRWMETFLNPIYLENSEIKEISCLSYEITEKKLIEAQMIESIHEKEILLQEVHHRVKNNLQVISSILNLQSSYVKDQNSLNILRESQNRIKSMSFIHESLYQTRDFSRIEFSDYILSLTNNLIHSYSIDARKISLVTDFRKVFLSLDQAIPCGLIVNELISNSLKYAFPKGEQGEIAISINEVGKDMHLKISDNGIGLPADLDVENSESLGLQLVYTLIDQLDATIQASGKNGTEYLITFEKQ